MKKALVLGLVLAASGLTLQAQNRMDLWNLYNTGSFNQLQDSVSKYLNTSPADGELNLMSGLLMMRIGSYSSAVRCFETVTASSSNAAWIRGKALNELATCYFQLQIPNRCKALLLESVALKSTQNLVNDATGRLKLFGLTEDYASWKIQTSEHFIFHFQQITEEEARTFIDQHEKAFAVIRTFFKSTLPKKIDFYVWNSQEDAQRILGVTLGFAKPEFCIVHAFVKQTTGHEMTHIISHYSVAVEQKTRFINEGTAVWFDQTNRDWAKLVKDRLNKSGLKPSIRACWQGKQQLPDEILYPLSALFVGELLSQSGKEKFLQMFTNQTYEHASKVYGSTLDSIIDDVEAMIR